MSWHVQLILLYLQYDKREIQYNHSCSSKDTKTKECRRLSFTKSIRDKLIIEFYAKPYNFCIAELIFELEPIIKENKFYMEMEFSYVHIDKQCTVEEKDLVNKIVKQFKSEN